MSREWFWPTQRTQTLFRFSLTEWQWTRGRERCKSVSDQFLFDDGAGDVRGVESPRDGCWDYIETDGAGQSTWFWLPSASYCSTYRPTFQGLAVLCHETTSINRKNMIILSYKRSLSLCEPINVNISRNTWTTIHLMCRHSRNSTWTKKRL